MTQDFEKRQAVVSSVRSTVAGYIMYWHKLCLEVSILISSGIVAIVTFGIDRASLDLTGKALLLLGSGMAVCAGVFLIVRAARLLQDLRQILVKVDKHDQLFDDNVYLKDESLYPKAWKDFDAVRMDLVPKWSIGLMLSTWAFISLLVLIGK